MVSVGIHSLKISTSIFMNRVNAGCIGGMEVYRLFIGNSMFLTEHLLSSFLIN